MNKIVEKISDRLVDRLFDLIDRQSTHDRLTFEKYISPAETDFQELHSTYLEAFKGYRDQLQADPGLLRAGSPLLDQIRTDNRFSAGTRKALHALTKVGWARTLENYDEIPIDEDGEQVLGFALAVRNYLLRSRAGDISHVQDIRDENPDHYLDQRFRQSLVENLEAVINENWQMCLDPHASMPPMTPDQITEELVAVARSAGIDDGDPDWGRKLSQAMAVRALDTLVWEMQEAYGEVMTRFHATKRALGVE